MSKHRIAALIAGGTLILGTGVAFAGEMDLLPQDPTLAPAEEPAVGDGVTDPAPAPADEDVADVESSDDEVAPVDDTSDDATDDAADVADDAAEADGEHGSIVSEAAHNHDFDEACGNHGAYVSEVAKGGDPANPTCDDDAEAADDAAVTSTDTDTADATATTKHGKGSAKERPAKASGGKAKHGK